MSRAETIKSPNRIKEVESAEKILKNQKIKNTNEIHVNIEKEKDAKIVKHQTMELDEIPKI